MARNTFGSTIAVLLTMAAMPGSATDIGPDDIARAVEIAELRYASDEVSAEDRAARLADIMPPSEDHWYRGSAQEATADRLHGRDLLDLSGSDLNRLLRDPATRAEVLELAGEQSLRLRVQLMLRSVPVVRSDDGEAAAWNLVRAAAGLLPPGPDLAHLHRLACPASERSRFGLHSLGSASVATGSVRVNTDHLPTADDDPDACPLLADGELARRIEMAWAYPARPYRLEGDAREAWLEQVEEFTEQLGSRLDRALLVLDAAEDLLGEYGSVPDALRQRLVLHLDRAATVLVNEKAGHQLVLEAARSLAVAGRTERAAELVRHSRDHVGLGDYHLTATLAALRPERPDLALAIARELASGSDRLPPCWVRRILVDLDDPPVARDHAVKLSLGQCRPLGDRWNGAVERMRKVMVEALLEQGRAREAFAIQALRHYRSFCGVGHGAATRDLQKETARLQISAGLDQRGAASDFLARMGALEAPDSGTRDRWRMRSR